MVNRFQTKAPMPGFYSGRITILQKAAETGRQNLMKELFEYYADKRYKNEGFGSFSAAYHFMQSRWKLPYKTATLRKYFSTFRAYINAGFEIEEICEYAISRLIFLKKYLSRLEPYEIRRLLWLSQDAFDRNIKHLKKEKSL